MLSTVVSKAKNESDETIAIKEGEADAPKIKALTLTNRTFNSIFEQKKALTLSCKSLNAFASLRGFALPCHLRERQVHI